MASRRFRDFADERRIDATLKSAQRRWAYQTRSWFWFLLSGITGIGYDAAGNTNAGYARVFFGSANFNTAVDARIDGTQGDGRFGSAIAGAGDIDGDGYPDLVVGAYEFDNGQLNEGRAYLYRGDAGAFPTVAHATLEVDQIESGFGSAVAGAGDVNKQIYAKLAVTARSQAVFEAVQAGWLRS